MQTRANIKVAILIVNHNGLRFLKRCLPSLFSSPYEGITQTVYVIDTGSDDGSQSYVEHNWSMVRYIRLEENRGYAGGNNVGWEHVQQELPDVQYILLLNADTIATTRFLEPLVSYMEQHSDTGSVQPKLLLYPETSKINSLGNVIHFLGFGYSSFCGVEARTVDDHVRAINYASGAAVMLRASAIRQAHLFEEFMFMYLEDLDLGWRLLLTGWKNVLIPTSVVYHEYEFTRGMKQYFYFERNRLYILLKNYRMLTLICLLPAFIIMELGMLMYAMKRKRLRDKLKTYAYFLSFAHLRHLFIQRAVVQRMRKCPDRELLNVFSGIIDFQPLSGPVLRYFVNPFLLMYLCLIRLIVVW